MGQPLTCRQFFERDYNENNSPQIATGFAGITLACNVKSEAAVHEVMELGKKAEAFIAQEPQKVFWGGYSGYFTDPNGYYWEVAYNPYWSFDENDMLILASLMLSSVVLACNSSSVDNGEKQEEDKQEERKVLQFDKEVVKK